jgi:hypothetical protein
MPVSKPARRLVPYIGALSVVLMLSSAGAGIASADPDDTSNSPESAQTSETGGGGEPPTTATAPVVPKGPLSQLRDALQRPLSIFGNGRPASQPAPKPVVKKPDRLEVDPDPELAFDPILEPADPILEPADPILEPDPVIELPDEGTEVIDPAVPPVMKPEIPPVKKSVGSSAEFKFGVARISIPLPTFPGTSDRQFSINLSDPESAFSSVQDTFASLNALVAEAYAPFNPFPPPPPDPTLRIMEEEPVIDSSGGAIASGALRPMSEAMPDLPVMQVPMMAPAVRLGPPRPVAETMPAGTPSQVLGVGSAGVRASAGSGSVTQGSVQTSTSAGTVGNTTPMSNTAAYRQGFPQYLRTARMGELAIVALPGIAGLLAITVSGGVIGYRQADSGRHLRTGAARFMP